jgi:hypothetical protein
MSTSHLKFYLLAIWGMIAVLSVALIVWAFTSPEAQVVLGMGASPTPTPTLSPTPLPSPTIIPTQRIIIATRNPNTPIPLPATFTPVTPLPMGQINGDIAPGFNPLTGLQVEDPSRLERRPVAVKISSFPRALRAHQSGLTLADVVYEYYIEDGLTRFIGIFYGKDAGRVGPVRSGRYFDEHIMRMYHSALVFANADERVENYLMESDLKRFLFLPRSDNCPPLCRDKTIDGYNNVFVDTAGVGPLLSDNSKQSLRPMFFYGTFSAFSMQAINRIFTHYSPYSYHYWEFDHSQGRYLRYSDTNDVLNGQAETYAPHIDRLTNQQLTADNVVVLVVPHNFKNDFDRADQVFDVQLTGSGIAYVFSNGLIYKGSWVRDMRDQSIQLFDNTKAPIRLKTGRTFYEVINTESSISQDDNDKSMHFTFFIPPRVFTPTPTPVKVKPRK